MYRNQKFLVLGLTLALVFSASLMTAVASAAKSRQIEVSEDGRLVATVFVERSKGEIFDITITRAGQPDHSYRYVKNFPALSASVGGQEVFTYLPKQAAAKTTDKGLVRQQLADDMKVLRAVRSSTELVALAEIAYAAVSGDDSLIFRDPSPALRAKVTRMEAVSLALSPCSDVCIKILDGCLANAATDKDKCYAGAFDCAGKCGNVSPVSPPEA